MVVRRPNAAPSFGDGFDRRRRSDDRFPALDPDPRASHSAAERPSHAETAELGLAITHAVGGRGSCHHRINQTAGTIALGLGMVLLLVLTIRALIKTPSSIRRSWRLIGDPDSWRGKASNAADC